MKPPPLNYSLFTFKDILLNSFISSNIADIRSFQLFICYNRADAPTKQNTFRKSGGLEYKPPPPVKMDWNIP